MKTPNLTDAQALDWIRAAIEDYNNGKLKAETAIFVISMAANPSEITEQDIKHATEYMKSHKL